MLPFEHEIDDSDCTLDNALRQSVKQDLIQLLTLETQAELRRAIFAAALITSSTLFVASEFQRDCFTPGVFQSIAACATIGVGLYNASQSSRSKYLQNRMEKSYSTYPELAAELFREARRRNFASDYGEALRRITKGCRAAHWRRFH